MIVSTEKNVAKEIFLAKIIFFLDNLLSKFIQLKLKSGVTLWSSCLVNSYVGKAYMRDLTPLGPFLHVEKVRSGGGGGLR